jgi:putative tricarboxylic transport membrane protein
MALRRLTLKQADAAASVAFFALAVAVMIEGYRLGPGWDDRGPESGFFPFSLAVFMAFGALASFIGALRTGSRAPFFENRQEILDLTRMGVPLAVAVIAVPWLGLYITTAIYISLFSWWYGSFRWYNALGFGIGAGIALYLTLVKAMSISMPMSVFYHKGLLPF